MPGENHGGLSKSSEDMLDVIQDFEEYRYPESEDGKPIKEEPIKDGYHDHGCDMIRYFFINQFPIKNREFKVRTR